jgi:serine/threonine-protein kinase
MTSGEGPAFEALGVAVCPCCGTRYPADARFCAKDGSPLRDLRELRAERDAEMQAGRDVGRFRIVRRLGTGGTGHVYLAVEHGTGRRCAVKTLDPEIAASADGLQRFRREATNHARIGVHPHVCALLDFGTTPDGVVYIALEYVDGEPLSALLRRSGSLPPARAATIVRQAADGLAVAHAHDLVHRDLKPENILLGRTAYGADHVTLIDFGIAKSPLDTRQRLTGTGVAVGTPLFMSPEQLAADAVDARSDVYALGLVAFLMLAGALPFAVGTPDAMQRRMLGQLQPLREVRPDVPWPAALQETLDRALAASPDDRYARVADFARDLHAAVVAWGARGAAAPLVERALLRGVVPRADADAAADPGAPAVGAPPVGAPPAPPAPPAPRVPPA